MKIRTVAIRGLLPVESAHLDYPYFVAYRSEGRICPRVRWFDGRPWLSLRRWWTYICVDESLMESVVLP